MKEKLLKFGKLNLAKELSRNELKKIVGGSGGGGGTGGGGTNPPPSGTHTVCSGGTFYPPGSPYVFGCAPAYCAGAGHGTFLYCY